MLNHLVNPHFAKALYPDGLPLGDVLISEVSFSWDGPGLTITLHTKELPKKPPKKWPEGFSQVVLKLEFDDISALSLSGFGTQNKASILHTPGEGGHEISIDSEELQLSFACRRIQLKDAKGYMTWD